MSNPEFEIFWCEKLKPSILKKNPNITEEELSKKKESVHRYLTNTVETIEKVSNIIVK